MWNGRGLKIDDMKGITCDIIIKLVYSVQCSDYCTYHAIIIFRPILFN